MLSKEYSFIAEPIYHVSGKLFAVEILTRFRNESHRVNMDAFFSSLEVTDKLCLLIEQIGAMQKHAAFFHQNNVLCSINVDFETLSSFLNITDINAIFNNFPYLRLELHESTNFQQLFEINQHLKRASGFDINHVYWLDDFDSSRDFLDLDLISTSFIKTIKIDKSILLSGNYECLYFLTEIIKSQGGAVIVEGVENRDLFDISKELGADFLQGFLFPHADINEINVIPLDLGF